MWIHGWLGRFAVAATMLAGPLCLDAQQPVVARRLELTLRPWGFDAKEFRLKPGRWSISVKNRAGSKLALRLDREAGPSTPAALLQNEEVERTQKPAWEHEAVLTPGSYLLLDTSKRGHQCRIIVAP